MRVSLPTALALLFSLTTNPLAAWQGTTSPPRWPHPEVPSLPVLTPAERARIAELLRLVILDDLTGKVPNREKVLQAFQNLGPEAVPQMLVAFNHVCNQAWTCPANIFGARLSGFLHRKPDLDLAEFYERHLGKGVVNPKPASAFADLKAAVRNQLKTLRGEMVGTFQTMPLVDLVGALAGARGARLRLVVAEVAGRKEEATFARLLDALRASKSPDEREAIHTALVGWAGAEPVAGYFHSDGLTANAVLNWRSWHKKGGAR